MKENNPLSPHIQIYNWHISSLISISHRITGIINIILITLICLWTALLLLGDINYELIQKFFETFFGKFLIMGTLWSFSFQILRENNVYQLSLKLLTLDEKFIKTGLCENCSTTELLEKIQKLYNSIKSDIF